MSYKRYYVSLNKLSLFLDNLKKTFANISHTHTKDEITDFPFPSIDFEILNERYKIAATYVIDTYTDVTFDIQKEGYTPIGIMPRTSGNGNVLIVGYGFGENDETNTIIDRSKATITFKNITNVEQTGGASLDVVYIKTN